MMLVERTVCTLLLFGIPVFAQGQQSDAARQRAVFPPLSAAQQAAKQSLIDSIEIESDADRPNIVLLFADDLGYGDLGCFGSSEIPTPRIDALASRGMKFTNAYVTAGTCSPSRAGLLTGQYQQRFGFEFNTSSRAITERLGRGLDPSAITIADTLRQAGYRTGMVGKWHQGSRRQYHPANRGFDFFYGFLAGAHAFIPRSDLSKTEIEIGGGAGSASPMLREFEPEAETGYLTDAFAREAVSFIKRQQPKQPYFLYVPFNAVHTPLQATKEYQKRFVHVQDFKRRVYYAMTSAMDDAVGRIVDAVSETGMAENTLVIFLNDNGGPLYTGVQSNGPLRMGKLFLFEGGVRVPLIIQWPSRIKGGSICDGVVSALDIMPTCCSVAGLSLPDAIKTDGVDLRPWLSGQRTDSPHQSLYWRNGDNSAMRKGNWKMIEVPNHVWLFDLDSDLGEQNNVAEQHLDRVHEMQQEFRVWESTLKDPAWPPKPNRPIHVIDGVNYRVNI
ncbi:MAG: sulfatase [Rubripirellula sp.]|nr:sulfatase [Rubripirellula sp.]